MATKDATIQGYLIPKGSQVCDWTTLLCICNQWTQVLFIPVVLSEGGTGTFIKLQGNQFSLSIEREIFQNLPWFAEMYTFVIDMKEVECWMVLKTSFVFVMLNCLMLFSKKSYRPQSQEHTTDMDVNKDKLQESPPAEGGYPRQAPHLAGVPQSWSGWGYPGWVSPGWGTPILTWLGVPWVGAPGWGIPLSWCGSGVPQAGTPGWGTPSAGPGRGTPLRCGQTDTCENSTIPSSYVRGR